MPRRPRRDARGRPAPAAAPASAGAGAEWRPATPRIALALALLLACVAFSPALRAPFQFDDLDTIPGNASIRRLWPPSVALHPPPDIATTGRPVVNYTFALNYAFNEWLGIDQVANADDPAATTSYRFVNLALHLWCALLLFGIVRRTLRSPPLAAWAASADGIAAVAAALWVLHPLQTEAVDYVTQRTELIVSACYLATLYSAIRGWGAAAARARRGWFAAALVASLVGMASKEVMITAPLVVALYGLAFEVHAWSPAPASARERRGFLAALAATAAVSIYYIVAGSRAETVGFQLGVPWYRYLYSQAWAVAHYLRLAFWPVGLTIDYGQEPVGGLRGVPGTIVLTGLLVAIVVAWRRSRPLSFAGAAFFLLLAPSSSVVPIRTEIAAERRFYLALAVVIVVACLGVVQLRRWMSRREAADAMRRRAAAVGRQWWLVPAACLLLAGATYRRSARYADPVALWRDAVARVPGNARAYHNLARALLHEEPPHVDEAESELRRAIAVDSSYLPAWPNLAAVLRAQGNVAEARRLLEHAVGADSNYVAALEGLGYLLVGVGENAAAVAPLERLAARYPSDEGLIALATAYGSLGRSEAAIAALRRALQLNPGRPDAAGYLAAALTRRGMELNALGRPAEGRHLFEEALTVRPDFVPAREALGQPGPPPR
ncbi:MAG: hypothetical protein U9Q74_00555 [Gemmatimonadota bacterium]|nr:hypothetical protein [Gemmatimonadota bacterium]